MYNGIQIIPKRYKIPYTIIIVEGLFVENSRSNPFIKSICVSQLFSLQYWNLTAYGHKSS